VLFWLFVPTLVTKYQGGSLIDERLKDMWRVHKNRTDKGRGATYNSNGFHEHGLQKGTDHPMEIKNWGISFSQLFNGSTNDTHIDNPFLRHHKSIADYSSHLADMDDYSMTQTDTFERAKLLSAPKDKVQGVTSVVPENDNEDDVRQFYEGENIFTTPPNTNYPSVDHGLDEDHIWAF
jgi:hypothetical protein